jgi:hypothetical protein
MKDNTGSATHAEQRRLAAIMFTDIVGFSRQMGSIPTAQSEVLSGGSQRASTDQRPGNVRAVYCRVAQSRTEISGQTGFRPWAVG